MAEIETIEYPQSVTLVPPDMALIGAAAAYRGASEIIVDSPAVYALVADDRKAAREMLAKLEAMRVYQKEPALEACRRIDAFFRAPQEWCSNYMHACDAGMLEFERGERAKREALQREAAREADERRRAIDAEAAKQRAAGNAFVADQLATVAKTVAQPIAVPSTVPKIAGLHSRKTWKVKITNKAEAVSWLMANNLAHCVELNETALAALGRSSQGQMEIPGVEFDQKDSKAQR